MPDPIHIVVNGEPRQVAAGASVAAALLMMGVAARRSVSGEERSPVCGMGVCEECRVTVNGRAGVRGCLVLCRDGMEVKTSG
ncbi:MAG: (2Fe-2S)-binding protein [Bryobacterales bacterium]|nr:(2Fe-2S)-binding protein [Bryobacterales bacterium]